MPIKKFLREWLNKARNNPDYAGAVATGYGLMGLQLVVQIILVPLYLGALGKYQFGLLMVLLSFIHVAGLGINWMHGINLRVLGEAFAKGDRDGFARYYGVTKLIFVGYGAVVAVAMVAAAWGFPSTFFGEIPDQQRDSLGLAVLFAAAYFVLLNDLSVEYVALCSVKRQIRAIRVLIVSVAVFAAAVVPWLLSGGGLAGIMGCFVIGAVVARIVAWLAWRGSETGAMWRWLVPESRPLLARLFGPMGRGYFLYGVIFLILQADILIVGLLGGAKAAAEFTLVWKIAEFSILVLWRVSEHLKPELVQMDVRGETDRLARVYGQGVWWLRAAALVTGLGYGLLGPWLVRLWVGAGNAPEDPIAYALAGAAIFWLGSARLPAVFAHALVRLRQLNMVAGLEVVAKLVLTVLLFPRFGILAPLIAISAVHLCGIAYAYPRLVKGI